MSKLLHILIIVTFVTLSFSQSEITAKKGNKRVKHKEAATFDGQLDDNDLSITTKDESKQTKNSTNNDTPIGKKGTGGNDTQSKKSTSVTNPATATKGKIETNETSAKKGVTGKKDKDNKIKGKGSKKAETKIYKLNGKKVNKERFEYEPKPKKSFPKSIGENKVFQKQTADRNASFLILDKTTLIKATKKKSGNQNHTKSGKKSKNRMVKNRNSEPILSANETSTAPSGNDSQLILQLKFVNDTAPDGDEDTTGPPLDENDAQFLPEEEKKFLEKINNRTDDVTGDINKAPKLLSVFGPPTLDNTTLPQNSTNLDNSTLSTNTTTSQVVLN